VPATNRAIAEELVLSVEAVKTHIRSLFAKFAVEDLPQNRQRVRLAELAHRAGVW
jgi:DNA-binding NarL/FixJ family response regulator